VALDLPGDAHLPQSYVAAEDARLEAYRRLAAATTNADVEDIGVEWSDRFGPLPGPALALLAVARLRTVALPRGITEITMSPIRPQGAGRPVVRIQPVHLAASAAVRLRRLLPGATYKEDTAQLLLPVPTDRLAADLVCEVLEDLIPVPDSDKAGGTL
jgi:transcription-repair coupling factor (superfamily II helicase)